MKNKFIVSVLILSIFIVFFSFLLIAQYQEFNKEHNCRIIIEDNQLGLASFSGGNIKEIVYKMEKEGESPDLILKTTCGNINTAR